MEQARIPDRYTLIEEVGQGGMAIVYRAQDQTLKREVAIKVLHQHLAAEPESKARLEREAQAVAKLRHENILEIFDYSGLDSATSYIVTEFIDGQTLKQFLAERPFLFPELAALVASEVCRALAHAHGVGIIHRDVKPENVMIRKDGLIKLMDFGIAQVLDLQRMTVTGQLLGSPAYMAPELIEGKPLDFRTDVFSVGIMLYLLATGNLPFAGKNPHEVLRRIAEGRFPDPRSAGRGVDASLARIINRSLARLPDDRYPDVSRLGADLQAYLDAAGLSDVRGELKAYFADPAGYEAALPPRMATALTATARRELAAHRTASALELWNRVLAFDPKNAEVATELRRLEGRARIRIAGLAVGGAGLVALVVFGLARLPAEKKPAPGAVVAPPPVAATPGAPEPAPGPPPPASPLGSPAPPAPVDDGSRPSAAAATAVDGELGDRTGKKRPLDLARRVAGKPPRIAARADAPAPAPIVEAKPVPAGPVATRTFTLGPTPQNVDVYLDGQRQFGYDVDHTTITVPWDGLHVIELKSPSGCCFVERIEVGPDRPLPPDSIIARRLKWRPARLVVTTDPPTATARVLVRDLSRESAATSARAGEEISVLFLPTDDPSKEVEIAVGAGEAVVTEQITLRAGQRLKHVMKLKAGGGN